MSKNPFVSLKISVKQWLKPKPDKKSIPSGKEKDEVQKVKTLTFADLRAKGGLDSALDYLQTNIIVPHFNQKLYERAGLKGDHYAGDKLILYGDDNEGIANMVDALAHELFNPDGTRHDGTVITISEEQNDWLTTAQKQYEDVHKLVDHAAKNMPAIIFVESVHPEFKFKDGTEALLSHIAWCLNNSLEKLQPVSKIVLILGLNSLIEKEEICLKRRGFTKILHVKKVWTVEAIRKQLIATTSDWEGRPEDAILDNMSKNLSTLDDKDMKVKIEKICSTAFRKCLLRQAEKYSGADVAGSLKPYRINEAEINPTEKDWDEAFAEVKNEEKSHG
ncbi:uncharacterized protein LOC110855543 [Folsomia candida]|uniref:uncharacterized protein LOC110855543 n=1 Tax=Folsomia candida TaxID=158441 RepID=UPI000B909FE9|nr:uncharacterized protein LOC110855543 [Folsomia candida]